MSYDPPGLAGSASDQYPSKLLADGVDTATSSRSAVSCTASATPHTAGAWVEVDPSLSANSSAVIVGLIAATRVAGVNSSTLLDIGTGAASSETVWATIGVGYREATTIATVVAAAPGHIASGTRVAVRARSAVVSQVVQAVYSFVSAKATALGAPVTIGANTGTSQGVNLTAPGSLNTKGAWTEITASTSAAVSSLAVFLQGASGTAMNTSSVLVDVGVGGSGSESVVIADLSLLGNASEYYVPRGSPPIYGVSVPAGSRLAARYARANAGNAVDLIVVGA